MVAWRSANRRRSRVLFKKPSSATRTLAHSGSRDVSCQNWTATETVLTAFRELGGPANDGKHGHLIHLLIGEEFYLLRPLGLPQSFNDPEYPQVRSAGKQRIVSRTR